LYKKGVGKGMVSNNLDLEKKYNEILWEYRRCFQTVALQQDDAEKVARELMRLSRCKIFPPILPASLVGAGIYRHRIATAKKAAMLTIRLSEQLREVWIYKTKFRPVVQIKVFDPLFGVIVEEAPLHCPFHTLVNAEWIDNRYPLWDFQIKDFCVIGRV